MSRPSAILVLSGYIGYLARLRFHTASARESCRSVPSYFTYRGASLPASPYPTWLPSCRARHAARPSGQSVLPSSSPAFRSGGRHHRWLGHSGRVVSRSPRHSAVSTPSLESPAYTVVEREFTKSRPMTARSESGHHVLIAAGLTTRHPANGGWRRAFPCNPRLASPATPSTEL